MIREFWVENYLSIRDRQTISFLTKGPDSFLSSEVVPGVFINKLSVFFGANASGKSNILYAIYKVFSILVNSKKQKSQKITVSPFELTKDKDTKMHVSFYANSIRYDYDVEFNENFIRKESLYYYPNSFKALFYERSYKGEEVQAEIKFGDIKISKKTQSKIIGDVYNNHSVLSVCEKKMYGEDILPLSNLHGWIMKYYHNIDGDNKKGIIETLKEVHDDVTKKTFYNLMLKKADLNIEDFYPTIKDIEIPEYFFDNEESENEIPEEIKEQLKNVLKEKMQDDINFVNNYASGKFNVPFRLQSKGTIRYLGVLGFLYDMITSNHVYLLDELGEDLHPDLLCYLLKVFLFNSEKSQLIISSQEISLLLDDMFNENRSLVWFADKQKETASSVYSNGNSFGLHKNLSLYNSYRAGRLGATPEIGSFLLNLDIE